MADWPEFLRDAADLHRQIGEDAKAYETLSPQLKAIYWIGSGKLTPDQLTPSAMRVLGFKPEQAQEYAQLRPYVNDQLARGRGMAEISAELGGLQEPQILKPEGGFWRQLGTNVLNQTADPTNFLTGAANSMVRGGLKGANPLALEALKRAGIEGADWQTMGAIPILRGLLGLGQGAASQAGSWANRFRGKPPAAQAAPPIVTQQPPAAPPAGLPPVPPQLALPPAGGAGPGKVPVPGPFQYPPWVREPRPPMGSAPGAAVSPPVPPPTVTPPVTPGAPSPGDAALQEQIRKILGSL